MIELRFCILVFIFAFLLAFAVSEAIHLYLQQLADAHTQRELQKYLLINIQKHLNAKPISN